MVNIADPAKAQRFCACYANTSAADVSSVMEQYRIPYVLSKITFGVLAAGWEDRAVEEVANWSLKQRTVWISSCRTLTNKTAP